MGYDGVPKSLLPDCFPGYLAVEDPTYMQTLELQTGSQAGQLKDIECSLARSFASLETRFAILSRANYSCCTRCAVKALEEFKNGQWAGYTYFTMQDCEKAIATSKLRLSYQAFDSDCTCCVGKVAASVFDDLGLELEWDGSAASTMTLMLKEDDCAFLKSVQAQMSPKMVLLKEFLIETSGGVYSDKYVSHACGEPGAGCPCVPMEDTAWFKARARRSNGRVRSTKRSGSLVDQIAALSV